MKQDFKFFNIAGVHIASQLMIPAQQWKLVTNLKKERHKRTGCSYYQIYGGIMLIQVSDRAMNQEICMGKKCSEVILCIYVGYRERKSRFVFWGVQDWEPGPCGHPRAPKLLWSAKKLPFVNSVARQPDGRYFLPKEISEVWHMRFKPCELFRHRKNILCFSSIVCFNIGPKPLMVVEFIGSEVQSVYLIVAMDRQNYVHKG